MMDNHLTWLDKLVISPWDRRRREERKLRLSLIKENVLTLDSLEDVGIRFKKRITALTWHPKYPYTYAVGAKYGEIVVGVVDRNLSFDCGKQNQLWRNRNKVELSGVGAGCSVSAIKFHESDMNSLYRASLDATMTRVDLVKGSVHKYHEFVNPYKDWFTALDVSFDRNVLIAGDTGGNALMFGLNDEKQFATHRLLKSKIHSIEFSKRDPFMFVTAGLDKCVKVWDLRMLNMRNALLELPHKCAVNVAKFNPVDGTKLMTSDQGEQIRIYDWNGNLSVSEPLIINHHHTQFQHLTPVRADWHPLADLIVIGKYPKDQTESKTIEFYDADKGKFLGEIYQPASIISSINAFNPTGELLASGLGSAFVIYASPIQLDHELAKETTKDGDDNAQASLNLSQEDRARLRAAELRRASMKHKRHKNKKVEEFSPASSEDEEEDDKPKKRSRKTASKKTKNTKKPSR